jgi:RNA polymerase sigma factor (sigma-70 family)
LPSEAGLGFNASMSLEPLIKDLADEDILRLIVEGTPIQRDQAINMLYWRWAGPMKRFFLAHGATLEGSEDVLQETFVKIWQGAAGYQKSGRASSWIWAIARNTLTDHHRRNARQPLMESMDIENPSHDPEAKAPYDHESDDCINRGLDLFAGSHPDRAYALELWSSGMDLQSLSVILGRSYGATRQFLLECRKKIKPYLSPCFESQES